MVLDSTSIFMYTSPVLIQLESAGRYKSKVSHCLAKQAQQISTFDSACQWQCCPPRGPPKWLAESTTDRGGHTSDLFYPCLCIALLLVL